MVCELVGRVDYWQSTDKTQRWNGGRLCAGELIMFRIVDLYSIDLFTALWQTFQLSTTSSSPSFLPQQICALWTLCVHISTILMIQPPFISQLVLRCGHTRLLACKIAFALTKNISDSQFVTFTSSLGQKHLLAFHKRKLFACNFVFALKISGFSFSFEN